jgi:Tol biopolymer transport system component
VFADIQGLRIQTLDGKVSYLVTQDSRDTSPAWSPDGQRIAFVRRQHDHWEVYVVNADGRNLRRLTVTPEKPNGEVGSSASPAWSPDGQHIAFLSDRRGKWEIWVMEANGDLLDPVKLPLQPSDYQRLPVGGATGSLFAASARGTTVPEHDQAYDWQLS